MGYVTFVVLLLALRRLRKRTSRGERERFVARVRVAQLTRLTEELDKRDYFDVVPPLDRALVRRFGWRNFRADLVLPLWLLLGYLIVRVFDEPRWAVALGLAVYLTVSVALTPYRLKIKGYRPIGGERTASEWVLVGPGLALRAAIAWAGIWLAFSGMSHCEHGRWLLGLGLDLAAFATLLVAHVPARVAERAGRRRRSVEFSAETPPDSVLLLRSFGDDDIRVTANFNDLSLASPFFDGTLTSRFEELVSWALFTSGPLIAIGRPGEPLPELGAARTYWPDDQWRGAVDYTAHRAERIVMVGGLTQGLAWEIENLRGWGLLQKVLVLLPPDTPQNSVRRLERVLADLGIDDFPLDLCHPYFVVGISFSMNTGELTPVIHTALGRTAYQYFATLTFHRLLVSNSSQREERIQERIAAGLREHQVEPPEPRAPNVLRNDRDATSVKAPPPTRSDGPVPLSSQAQRCIDAARADAVVRRASAVTPGHLILGVIAVAPADFEALTSINARWAADQVIASFTHDNRVQATTPEFDADIPGILRTAEGVAVAMGSAEVLVRHLVVAAHQHKIGGISKAIPFFALTVEQARAIARGHVCS